MSKPRPSIFRDALQVSPERIAAMNDADLNHLMRQLLTAQAYKCGSPRNEIRVNTEGKAKDDGCDGWTAKAVTLDDWLGSTDTCWQFKSGSDGEPAKLSGEVSKPIPKETLHNGDRFVVVASGSTNGKKGEQARLKVLAKEAAAASVPNERIEVIGGERLTNWCNEHPAVAAHWAGRPAGLWSLDDWANSDEHQVPWQASATAELDLDARRADLDFETGNVLHLHIQGPPGVGKTRFALELCRTARWSSAVIYIRQASDIRLLELIDGAVAETGVRLVVVADEVQPDQLRPLRDSVGRGTGRIRLITIGHSPSPDPSRIPALSIKPLDAQVMRKIINGWYPAMPPEHVDFVTHFADGYVRLAKLAADAVARDAAVNVHGLLNLDEIRTFLDKMLGMGERRPLYVLAVLTSVGWTEDKEIEARRIASHFGLDWNWVREKVDDFDRRFGIAPRGGRYRYISPTPLGIYLAIEAWTTYPEILRTLADVLPTEEAKEAYYGRLRSIASNPQARDFALEELRFFFRLNDFIDPRTIRRWAALSCAAPEVAARNILNVLTGASIDERRQIEGQARREAVWTLVRLAWQSSSFSDAAKSLALLGEAENESWANNASAEFVAKFQIYLSGTAVPYLDRLPVLDELLSLDRAPLAKLVIKALAQVGEPRAFRAVDGPPADELPEDEWRPRTGKEHLECVRAAINRLSDVARRKTKDVQTDLVDAAKTLSMMLRRSPARGLVASYFETVRMEYPETREALRRIIAELIHHERKFWKELTEEGLSELETLHARFEDQSLSAWLQQFVGQAPWDRDELPDLTEVAKELLSTPNGLVENWPWLTSGDASDGWRLGEALAAEDEKGALADQMPSLPDAGRDLRVLCGYINTRRRIRGDAWYDDWIAAQFQKDPKPVALLFEVAWRCGATVSVAKMLVELLHSQEVNPQIVGQLGFVRWGENLPIGDWETVVRAMCETGHRSTAVAMLADRIKTNPEEINHWKPLALELTSAPELVRSSHMTSYYWKEVANAVVADYPSEIAAAIFREQADRESGTWFAEYSDAAKVLLDCVKQDPSGVWTAMQPHLASRADAYRFSIGFPKGVMEHMPTDELVAWITENPEQRAAIIARLSTMDLSTDDTLAARMIGAYGDNEDVASEFFSEYVSGGWWGSASSHWQELAEALDQVSHRTALPKLRRWATESARSLRKMAQRDRVREEEEELRGR